LTVTEQELDNINKSLRDLLEEHFLGEEPTPAQREKVRLLVTEAIMSLKSKGSIPPDRNYDVDITADNNVLRANVRVSLDRVLEGAARASERVASWPEWKRALSAPRPPSGSVNSQAKELVDD